MDWSGFKHVWIDNLTKQNNGTTNDDKSNTNQGYVPNLIERVIRKFAEDAANGNRQYN
jgi:hypothetical protein